MTALFEHSKPNNFHVSQPILRFFTKILGLKGIFIFNMLIGAIVKPSSDLIYDISTIRFPGTANLKAT